MITIWKFEIPIENNFALQLPVNSKVLSFQLQKDVPTIWVQVDTEVKLTEREFRLCGTGHNLGYKYWNFIGTIQISNGDLVFHLFEKER